MAVKTITIDMEAYAQLSTHKRGGQSFSQVIKARFGPQPTAGRFLERIRSSCPSASTLDGVARQVRARRGEPVRAATR